MELGRNVNLGRYWKELGLNLRLLKLPIASYHPLLSSSPQVPCPRPLATFRILLALFSGFPKILPQVSSNILPVSFQFAFLVPFKCLKIPFPRFFTFIFPATSNILFKFFPVLLKFLLPVPSRDPFSVFQYLSKFFLQFSHKFFT